MMDKNGKGGRGEDAPLREMDTVPLDDDIDDDEEDEEEDFATPPAQPTTPAQQQEHEQEHEQKQKKEPASSAKAPARKKNPSSSGGSRGSSSSSGGHDPASGMAFHQQDDPHDADFEALPNVVKVKKEYEGHMGSTLGQSRQQTFTLPLGVAFPASEASTAPPISTEMDPSAPSPGENPNPYPYDANKHPLCKRIVDFLATEHLEGKTWKGGKSKTEIPKMALAKLLRGTKHDRKEVSEYFDSLSGPWGTMGSKHPLNSSGDYDYTAIGLAFILLNFDDAALPREIKYIIATRLMPPNATDPVLTVPKSLVSVLETENHLLMLNGSLYLFNLYATRARLAQPVDVSGLKSFLYVLLKEILRAGPWAYNSRPFLGHFIIALLVLHESCEPDFRHLCSKVLDFLVFCFALGSIDFRRRAPFRRKADHAGKPGLMDNALSAMSLVWAERAGIRHTAQSTDPRFLPISDKAIYAIAASYCPHPMVLRLAATKSSEYYARLGHGPYSPELFAAGPGWLLAAGGAGHGKSEVVAGPTVLMLQHDGASSIHDTFHLTGKGKSWKHFNNTGVLYNFAVTNGAPKPPAGMWPVKESANWSLYAGPSDVIVITHKGKGIGLLAVFDRNNCSSSLLDELIKVNGGELSSKDRIEVPHGVKCMAQRKGVRSFSYDVTQGHGAWVITEVNDQPTNTDFSTWPLIDIEGRWFPQQPEPHHLKALWADNQ